MGNKIMYPRQLDENHSNGPLPTTFGSLWISVVLIQLYKPLSVTVLFTLHDSFHYSVQFLIDSINNMGERERTRYRFVCFVENKLRANFNGLFKL